jgi:hypothetical protein
MFQRYGMILESRMQVGLRQVAGVARLGKEAEVGQFQVRDDTGYLGNGWCIGLPLKKGMGKYQAKEQDACAKEGEAKTGFPQGEPCPAHVFGGYFSNQSFS